MLKPRVPKALEEKEKLESQTGDSLDSGIVEEPLAEGITAFAPYSYSLRLASFYSSSSSALRDLKP